MEPFKDFETQNSFLDHHAIDLKLKHNFLHNLNAKKSPISKLPSPQSALSFLLSFIGGILVTIWLFFLLTFFGFNMAKAESQLGHGPNNTYHVPFPL